LVKLYEDLSLKKFAKTSERTLINLQAKKETKK